MSFFFKRRNRGAGKQQRSQILDTVIPLEKRILLSGNALVNVNGGNVTIFGDSANNTIELTVIGNNVVVRGLEGTTINGAESSLIVAEGATSLNGSVFAALLDGNDTFLLSRDVTINGGLVVDAGSGNDNVGATSATISGSVEVHGREGDNQVSFSDTTVDGRLWIKTGSGADVVHLDNVTVNGRLKIKTGAGADDVSLNNVTVSQKASIHTQRGDDDVAVQNSTFDGHFKVRTRQNADAVVLEGNTFNQVANINTGRNIDNVLVRGTNTFNNLFHANAGDGHSNGLVGDAVETASTTVFNAGTSIRRNESTTADTSVISARIDNATTGAIARGTAAAEVLSDLLVAEVQDLTLDLSANVTTPSVNNVLITQDPNFVISGTTTPLATITLDTDGDGQFDDGTVIADETGAFTTTVVLERRDLKTTDGIANDELTGFQTIALQSIDELGGLQSNTVKVDYVVNTVVQFVSNQGTYEVELFDDLTPNTVANFLGYSARYEGVIIHRAVTNFVIQGGGFTVQDGVIDNVDTDPAITNEFNSITSNIRGTLSMAQLGGDINSGTSQWFVNTADNDGSVLNNLDAVPHTVFGRVIGEGMSVVDSIAALSRTNLTTATGVSALTDTPLRTPFTPLDTPLTGTVSTTNGSALVTGVGTRFTEELTSSLGNPGGSRSQLSINGTLFEVLSISSDTELLVSTPATEVVTGATARTNNFDDDAFVRFSSISKILDQI